MKVYLKQNINSDSINSMQSNKIYTILCIENGWYRIINDNLEPGLYNPCYFKIADKKVDSDWIVIINEDDCIDKDDYIEYLGPEELSYKYFFEDLFDSQVSIINQYFTYLNNKNITSCMSIKKS